MKPELQLRKAVVLLKCYEADYQLKKNPDSRLICDYLAYLSSTHSFSKEIDELIKKSRANLLTDVRDVNTLRYYLLDCLGESRADWDFDDVLGSDKNIRCVYPVNLFLDGIRSPFNAGSMIRTAEAMGFSRIFYSDDMTVMNHDRTRRTSMGASDRIPTSSLRLEKIPGPIIALELGGSDLYQYQFPQEGTLVVGSEELGVSSPFLERASCEGGIVSIPLYGSKASLNVGTAFSIVAYEWIKQINLAFKSRLNGRFVETDNDTTVYVDNGNSHLT